MKLSISCITLLFFLSSCTKYQYLKLAADDTRLFQTNEFVAENDTFRVVYQFSEKVKIAIVNKSAASLEIDWNRSFFVRPGKSHEQLMCGGSNLRTTELIPAGKSINYTCIAFRKKKDKFIPLGKFSKTKEHLRVNGQLWAVRRAQVERSKSPLTCRIMLTLYAAGNRDQPVLMDRSFYLSEVIATKLAPENMPESEQGAIVEKGATFTGGVLYGIAVLPVLVILAILPAGDGD